MDSIPIVWGAPARGVLSGPDLFISAARDAIRNARTKGVAAPSDAAAANAEPDGPEVRIGSCPYCGKRLVWFFPTYQSFEWIDAEGHERHDVIPYVRFGPGFRPDSTGVWRRAYGPDQLYGYRGRQLRRARAPKKLEHIELILGGEAKLGQPWIPYQGEFSIACPGRGNGRRACGALVRVMSPSS